MVGSLFIAVLVLLMVNVQLRDTNHALSAELNEGITASNDLYTHCLQDQYKFQLYGAFTLNRFLFDDAVDSNVDARALLAHFYSVKYSLMNAFDDNFLKPRMSYLKNCLQDVNALSLKQKKVCAKVERVADHYLFEKMKKDYGDWNAFFGYDSVVAENKVK